MNLARDLSIHHVGLNAFGENFGGLERYQHELCEALADRGLRVAASVAGGVEAGRGRPAALHRRFSVGRADEPLARRAWRCRSQVRAGLRGGGLAVIHHAAHAWLLPPGLPSVAHFHGPWADESAQEGGAGLGVALKRRCERRVLGRAARVITLSLAFANLVQERLGVPAERVRVVPGGIRAADFAVGLTPREARERLGWPTDRPTVVSVRRLARRMGLDTLVDATAALRRRVPDVQVMIAGRGPMHDELTQRIANAGLRDHVRLIGFVPEDRLATAYRAADVSVVPTRALEGFGLVVLESLAAGTPCVVTPVGGLPEVAAPLEAALVTASTDAGDLAAVLAAALRGETALPDWRACRAYVRERFDWSAVVPKVLAVYAEARAAHGGS